MNESVYVLLGHMNIYVKWNCLNWKIFLLIFLTEWLSHINKRRTGKARHIAYQFNEILIIGHFHQALPFYIIYNTIALKVYITNILIIIKYSWT